MCCSAQLSSSLRFDRWSHDECIRQRAKAVPYGNFNLSLLLPCGAGPITINLHSACQHSMPDNLQQVSTAVFLAGAARSHMPLSVIYVQNGGDYHGRHITDTLTMRWQIYYVHPQSGHMLGYARQQWVAQLLQPCAVAKICRQT